MRMLRFPAFALAAAAGGFLCAPGSGLAAPVEEGTFPSGTSAVSTTTLCGPQSSPDASSPDPTPAPAPPDSPALSREEQIRRHRQEIERIITENQAKQSDQGTSEPAAGPAPASPAPDASRPSREERIRRHREKIDRIITENRAKRLEEQASQPRPLRQRAAGRRAPEGSSPASPAGAPSAGSLWYLDDFVTPASLQAREERAPALTPADLGTSASLPVFLAFSGTSIERVLQSLNRQTGIPITARGRAAGRQVSIVVQNVSLEEALRQLTAASPGLLIYAPSGGEGGLQVWDYASFRTEVLPRYVERRVFDVRHITVHEANSALASLLTPSLGRAIAIPSNGKLVVSDLPRVLSEAEELLRQIDQEAPETQSPVPVLPADR